MRLPDHLGLAFAWRYLCHAIMLGLGLLAEPGAAPRLADLILDALPKIDWVASHNYWLWLGAYLPIAAWLWRIDRQRFVHFLWVGGLISLARGVCLPLTGLGPTDGLNPNAALGGPALWSAWLDLINPISALKGAANVHLTKDLFFSGHTASTFLLWLYCRDLPRIGPVALLAHLFVVAVVFAAHLHYTIDVVGAWAITFSVFVLARRRVLPPR